MSKYYYLIAGLPDISLDDSKCAYSVFQFREEILSDLSSEDRKLIDLFFLKFDNQNVLSLLKSLDSDIEQTGGLTVEDISELIKTVKEDGVVSRTANLPSYFPEFIYTYVNGEGEDKQLITWEDRLASLYYTYAMNSKNEFVRNWFEFNLDINNVLTAMTSRKYGLDKNNYIVGNNEVAEALRTSNARDFGLGESLDSFPVLQRIAEETDLLSREKKIDLLKWEWLEENTFFKPFDIESIFAYLLKLEMIERWTKLDKATGEKTFRELIGGMKKGSDHALEEFKRNNKK